MGGWDEQEALVDDALSAAPDAVKRYALDGTIGDTRAFCWGALRQFNRRSEQLDHFGSPRASGLNYVDLHLLLIVAHETVDHVEVVEKLLRSIGQPTKLPPDQELRHRLREARNLL